MTASVSDIPTTLKRRHTETRDLSVAAYLAELETDARTAGRTDWAAGFFAARLAISQLEADLAAVRRALKARTSLLERSRSTVRKLKKGGGSQPA